MAWNQADPFYISNVHAFKAHWGTNAETGRIVEVGCEGNFPGKDSAGATHQKNEDSERDAGKHDRQSDTELRPLQLFLTRHDGWPNNSMTS